MEVPEWGEEEDVGNNLLGENNLAQNGKQDRDGHDEAAVKLNNLVLR